MGRDIISYISKGDEILFTLDKHHIYIYNLARSTNYELEDNIYSQIDIDLLKHKASNIKPRPQQIAQTIYYSPNLYLSQK